VLTGLHNNITLSFMIAGHTKFSPDWCFGLLANVVNTSANVNTTQLTGTPDGTVIVPTYDWQTFLYEHTKKLVGIKSFHHLRFSSTTKGHVFARLKSDSPEVDFNLLKDEWTPTATDLPERLTPSGLSPARQWYLFQKIREFCPEEARDITCPKPSMPDPSTDTTSSTVTTSITTTTPAGPSEPTKRPRHCGIFCIICRFSTIFGSFFQRSQLLCALRTCPHIATWPFRGKSIIVA